MNKILIRLGIIGIVAAVAIGGTIAYFSDTETSVGNTIVAGTIDIDVDGDNPWTQEFTIDDLKPGETENKDFQVNNVGNNAVNLSKKLFHIVGSGGILPEPECEIGGGVWDRTAQACDKSNYTEIDNIQERIYYDLSVEVYDGSSLIWWQEIETGSKILTTVYSDNDTYIDLGMIPVGGYMIVHQSYHFDKTAGNEYQGDKLTFDMEFRAEQLVSQAGGYATVALENKSGAPDWTILGSDIYKGTLAYKTKGAEFDFIFDGIVKTTENYTLIYVGNTDNYPCSGSVDLGNYSFTAGTSGNITAKVDTGTIADGKIWLIPTSSYDGSVMTSWPEANILFETGLINYEKTL